MLRLISYQLLVTIYQINSKMDIRMEAIGQIGKIIPTVSTSSTKIIIDQVFYEVYKRVRKCLDLKYLSN